MGEWIHILNSPAEVVEVARRIEQDRIPKLSPDYSWRRRARDLVDIVNAAEAGEEGQREAIEPMLQVSRLGPITHLVESASGGQQGTADNV